MMVAGDGIYTVNEVSRYTGLPAATVRSWFKARSDRRGLGRVFDSDYEQIGDDFAVSFLNLIDVHVAKFFRDNGVKLPYIRRAHDILAEELHTPHPFAHKELSTDGTRIIREKAHGARDFKYVDVIAKQLLFPEFQNRLTRIDYSAATNLAESWRIREGVIINPLRGFGKPVVENSSVATLIIANQYQANGSNAALVARLFKIDESAVRNAVNFEKHIKRIAA